MTTDQDGNPYRDPGRIHGALFGDRLETLPPEHAAILDTWRKACGRLAVIGDTLPDGPEKISTLAELASLADAGERAVRVAAALERR